MNPGRHLLFGGCLGRSERSDCHPRIYNEEDILNNLFNANAISNINGDRWNSTVYLVHLPGTSSMVVVKKFQNESGSPVDASLDNHCQSEVNLLGRIHHGSIISIENCIRRDNFLLLVYGHGEKGSLHRVLHSGPEQGLLNWPMRRAIAIAVAEGLHFLHNGGNNPVVHHNINSDSILLDADLKPKIAGFDLARVSLGGPDQPVPVSEFTAANMFGYTAPEYATLVTAKVDTYSYGVVLLELVTGRVAYDHEYEDIGDGHPHLATWAGRHCNRLMENTGDFIGVVDIAIRDQAPYFKEMAAMFKLGVDCTVRGAQERPSMREVLYRLRNLGR